MRSLLFVLAWVLASPHASAFDAARDVMLEVELTPSSVYVQAQTVYRMRFMQAVDVRDLKITGPTARLAEIRPLGESRLGEVTRQGKRYRVHVRDFAVFPFSSGELELTGASVEGRVAAVGATAADGRQLVRLDAPVQKIMVRPVPAQWGSAPWLAAHSLTLSERWEPGASHIQVGQTLLRHVKVEALGVDAAQIPAVAWAAEGMLVYAEPAKLENLTVGELNFGVREQTFRVAALQGGTVNVPMVALPWWNLKTDSPNSARLPQHTWQVSAGDPAPAPLLTEPPAQASRPKWVFWLGLFEVLAFAALCAWLYAKRRILRALWRLNRAARAENPGAVRDALLQWAAIRWPDSPPLSLEALGKRLNDHEAQDALQELDQSLYGVAALGYSNLKLKSWVTKMSLGAIVHS